MSSAAYAAGVDPVDDILGRLKGVKHVGAGWDALCPAHDDQKLSLSVSRGDDGRVLLFCHAGCLVERIVAALDLEMSDLFAGPPPTVEFDVAYDYVDEEGMLLFQAVRKPGKEFRARRPRPDGGWEWNLTGVRRVPYRLPELLNAPLARTIYLPEGEKDVESVRALGLVATTNPLGAGKWRPEFNEYFRDRPVVILPDNDEPGLKHAIEIAGHLHGIASSVRLVQLPNLPPKGDVTDWIRMGGLCEELERLAGAAPLWDPDSKSLTDAPPATPAQGLISVTLEELLAMPASAREYILSPWLKAKDLAMIFAFRGVGKTWMSLGIALAVASGMPFLKWTVTKPRKVLLVDGEMPFETLRERSAALCRGLGFNPEGRLSFICADLQDGTYPNISAPEGQAEIEKHLDGVELLILDNLSCLCGGIVENESDAWEPIQVWLLSLRRRGISVLLMHHAGKGGDQRGASKKEDVLDVSILLKTPRDYEAQEGARFEIHFKKARGLAGECVVPFQATARERPDKGVEWATTDLGDLLTEKIVELKIAGLSQRDIAAEVDLDVSNVNRRLKAARAAGLLPADKDSK